MVNIAFLVQNFTLKFTKEVYFLLGHPVHGGPGDHVQLVAQHLVQVEVLLVGPDLKHRKKISTKGWPRLV